MGIRYMLFATVLWLCNANAQVKEQTIYLGSGQKIPMAYISGGSFLMGSSISAEDITRLFGGKPESYADELPQHKVSVPAFWLGKYEITKAQFRVFVQQTHYKTNAETAGWAYYFNGQVWEKKPGIYWDNPGFAQEENHPAVYITWYDAMAFCKWLTEKSGLKCTLPTEAQWEYAARAGSNSIYAWGNAPDAGAGQANAADQCLKKVYPQKKAFNWNDGYVYTAPAGSYAPNRFGIYDMTGNVWEWCADKYNDRAYQNKPDTVTGNKRTLRGGCWLNDPGGSRISDRNGWPSASDSYGGYGFRIVVKLK